MLDYAFNEDITLWLPEQGVSPMGQPIYVDYYAVDILGNKEETHHDVFTSETKKLLQKLNNQ